jgi:CelD/BcsL family acetyltransferase involved in cellulose biosynthesis
LDAEARRLGEAIGKPVYEHAASYIVASSAAAELRFKLNRIADERERQAAKEELRAMERQHDPSAAAELAAKAQREFSQDELSRRRQKLRLDEPLPEYAHVGEFGSGE